MGTSGLIVHEICGSGCINTLGYVVVLCIGTDTFHEQFGLRTETISPYSTYEKHNIKPDLMHMAVWSGGPIKGSFLKENMPRWL